MNVNKMTREQLEEVPRRKWDENIGSFRSMIILPAGDEIELHDSGYRLMDFVAVDDKGEPICRLSGCSDVIHIDGIGGFGRWDGDIPRLVKPVSWSIDCLPVSGLLNIFPRGPMTCDAALSSFEIYAERK